MIPYLDKLKVGDYSTPIVFKDEQDKQAVKLVFLQSRTEPHRENLRDDYDRIAQRALEEKKEKMSNANLQSKSSINLNSSKKVFPSSQKNFKPKKIGIDIQVRNSAPFSFDLVATGSYKQATLSGYGLGGTKTQSGQLGNSGVF